MWLRLVVAAWALASAAALHHEAPRRRRPRRRPLHGSSVATYEADAVAAAEAWSLEVTDFIDESTRLELLEVLSAGGRADVGVVCDGGYSDAKRCRCTFANPEMVEACQPAAILLRVTADFDASDLPLPNALADIGVPVEQVGDWFYGAETSYVSVAIEAQATVKRLLPKVLAGVCTVAPATEPPQGDLRPTDLARLDKRKQKK